MPSASVISAVPAGFNEAAGFTRRKPVQGRVLRRARKASMRPPVLPGGNAVMTLNNPEPAPRASMRPPVLPGGNPHAPGAASITAIPLQ